MNRYTNGAYKVNLKLKHQIAEYLPMWGKKAQVYYHGIPLFCRGYFSIGHNKSTCGNKTCSWKRYIDDLLDSGILEEYFK